MSEHKCGCKVGRFYEERGAICNGHQNADGTPHLTYFIATRGLSFVWNGCAPRVEVGIGGYGEPVYHHFPIEPTRKVSPEIFGQLCDRWAAENPDVSEQALLRRRRLTTVTESL